MSATIIILFSLGNQRTDSEQFLTNIISIVEDGPKNAEGAGKPLAC